MQGVHLRAVRAVLGLALVALVGHGFACGESGGTGAAMARKDSQGEGGVPEAGAPAEDGAVAASAPDAGQEGAALHDTPAVEARVSGLLAQMTLDEKIGQMIMVDYGALASLDDITTYFLGALLPSGDEAPADNAPRRGSTSRAHFRPKALATRLGIPLIVGIDAVHGNAKVAGATVFPHDIGLGCARDPGPGDVRRAGHGRRGDSRWASRWCSAPTRTSVRTSAGAARTRASGRTRRSPRRWSRRP